MFSAIAVAVSSVAAKALVAAGMKLIDVAMTKDWTRRAYLHETENRILLARAHRLSGHAGLMRDAVSPYGREPGGRKSPDRGL